MKTEDLYILVSTNEQAEKGFSVKYQEDILRRHCLINSIQVHNIFFEDFPARNFKRPTCPQAVEQPHRKRAAKRNTTFSITNSGYELFFINGNEKYESI